MLAQNNQVTAVDLDAERAAQVNARACPIVEADLERYLRGKAIQLIATTDASRAYEMADFVAVARPTIYGSGGNYFDASSVKAVLRAVVAVNNHATIAIKSTVPVG